MAFFPAIETRIARRKGQQPDIYPNLLMTTLRASASGSAAIAEGHDTSAASGGQSTSGSAAIPEGSDNASGSGSGVASWQIRSPIDGQAARRKFQAQLDQPPNLLLTTLAGPASGSGAISEGVDVAAGTGGTTSSWIFRAPIDGQAIRRRYNADENALLTVSYYIPPPGIAAITESADAASGAGSMFILGVGAAAESNDVAAGSGGQSVSGSAAIPEPADIASGTGGTPGIGAGAANESPDAVNASGGQAISGAAAIPETADIAAGIGSTAIAGSGAAVELPDIATGSGTGAGSASGSGAILEPPDTASGSGSGINGGAAAIPESADVATAAGGQGTSGSAAIAESHDTASAAGTSLAPGVGHPGQRIVIVDGQNRRLLLTQD